MRQTHADTREVDERFSGDFTGKVEWRPMVKDGIRFSRGTLPAASAWVLEVDGRFEWLAFLDGIPGPVGLGESPSFDLARTSAEAAMGQRRAREWC